MHTELLRSGSKAQFLSKLQEDILRVFLYFDIFQHPLKTEEVYEFLPSDSTSPAEILTECTTPPLNSIVAHEGDHFFVANGSQSRRLPGVRLENERRAKTYFAIAQFLAGLIRRFPFVRAVFVSGELSKGVATRQGDIDFFIITAVNRLWIARTLLIAFKKSFLLNRKKFFCLNHFISEDYLDVTDRNIYSALEIVTLKPLHNLGLYAAYRNKNSWVKDYFPNLSSPPVINNRKTSPSFVQRVLEAPLSGKLGDVLDSRLMGIWRQIWNRRYSGLPKERKEALFRSEKFISTAYAGDFQSKVFKEYSARLERFGLGFRRVER